MNRFRACERQAREQGKELWGEGLVQDTTAVASQPLNTGGGEIRGNRKSKIYHLPNCPNYQDLSPTHVVAFPSEAQAIQAGYRKAKNCP
jgi:hypothetical protein